MGFCLFNNVAVAARHALDGWTSERVLVLDWDVHHGNGTNDIFYDVRRGALRQHPPVAAVSGHGRADGQRRGRGRGVHGQPAGAAGRRPRRVARPGRSTSSCRSRAHTRPDLLLVSAGFDAHRDDPLANCALTEESYAAMAAAMRDARRASLDAPLGFVLEGGYDLGALARVGCGDDRAARWMRRRREPVEPGALARGAAATTRAGGRALASCAGRGSRRRRRAPNDAGGLWQKEGRRASTAPLPPASKAPQRLALPPGSLVCNDRRKGDRRGADSLQCAKRWLSALCVRRRWNSLRSLPACLDLMPSVEIGH